MPKKRKRGFYEMRELQKEYKKALKQHRQELIELAKNKDIEGMEKLGPWPLEPSEYEEISND